MNTYRTYFYNDLQWCECDIVARTPDEAIEIARRIVELDPEGLLTDYSEGGDRPIRAIEVVDDDGYRLAEWQDDEVRSRLAGRDLLAANRRPSRGQVRDQADILFERVYRDGKEVIYATTCYEGPCPWGAP